MKVDKVTLDTIPLSENAKNIAKKMTYDIQCALMNNVQFFSKQVGDDFGIIFNFVITSIMSEFALTLICNFTADKKDKIKSTHELFDKMKEFILEQVEKQE